MIRPVTCVSILLAIGSGLYLYQIKHRSQMLDREIVHTLRQTDAVRDRIGVLRGEWALLNEPERLAELSRQHLGLKTLAPSQFASMADLGGRLPAPGNQTPPAEGPANEPVASETPAPKPYMPAQVAAAAPTPAPAPPAVTRIAAKPATRAGAAATTEPSPAPRAAAPIMTASAVPARPRRAAPSAPSAGAERRSLPAPEPKVAVLQASAYVTRAPVIASALGGSYRALPPPVPFAANPAAIPGGR